MLQTTVMRVHYKHCTIWPGLHLSQLVYIGEDYIGLAFSV